MKLKEFNLSNSKLALPGEPILRINSKAGLFGFSKAAVAMMGFNRDTKIVVLQYEENLSDWYIKPTISEDAFPLRKKDDSVEFAFNSTHIAKRILESIKTDKLKPTLKASGFKISKKPQEIEGEIYWTIITANPLNPR